MGVLILKIPAERETDPFHRIDFGLAAAEDEKQRNPSLLLEGFLETRDYVSQVRDGPRFLLLGRKGSGKSAIGCRIQLLSQQDASFRTDQWTLTDFPFNAFAEILRGEETPEVRFAANWEFLLLIALIDSFGKDPDASATGEPSLSDLLDLLGKLGLLAGRDLSALVKQTSKREFRVGIPRLAELRSGEKTEDAPNDLRAQVRLLFRTLQEACLRVTTPRRHIVFIDGLDDVQTQREIQYRALAALVVAVDRLNLKLTDSKVNAKVVLLCRTDLFNQLHGPNLNKVLQDSSILLNWYDDTREPERCDLISLVNHRATFSLGEEVNVFERFVPHTIHGQPAVNFLLDHTRHNPRDIIQLINRVQRHSRADIATEQEVLNACRDYSETYFRQEIQDEVSRLPDSSGAIRTIGAIGMLGKKQFDADELARFMAQDGRFKSVDSRLALQQLFECSAVGNVRGRTYAQDARVVFRYRNSAVDFNPNDAVLVHRGLLKALALV